MVVDCAVYKRTPLPPMVKQMRPLRGVFCFSIPKNIPINLLLADRVWLRSEPLKPFSLRLGSFACAY